MKSCLASSFAFRLRRFNDELLSLIFGSELQCGPLNFNNGTITIQDRRHFIFENGSFPHCNEFANPFRKTVKHNIAN